MSQDVTWLGNNYTSVPFVTLPKTGGGTALFSDPSGVTATAADVASGKYFLDQNGELKQGTASGGGGGSSWTLLGSKELTVNTTSSTASSAGTIDCGASAWDKNSIIYVRIRDKAGPRAGYFYGSDAWFSTNHQAANSSTSNLTSAGRCGLYYTNGLTWGSVTASYGVYGYSISSTGTVTIRKRYSGSTGTINGTFLVQVYAIPFPDGKSPFNTGTIT